MKALPWALLLQGATVVAKRWRSLSERDRSRLSELLRGSRGRVGNLSSKERAELRKLLRKLDLKRIGTELLPLVRGARRKRR